jgi:hypothetical protein
VEVVGTCWRGTPGGDTAVRTIAPEALNCRHTYEIRRTT